MRSCNPLSLWHGSCLPVPRPLNQFPAGEKCWMAARGGHARGDTARAGAAHRHDGQATTGDAPGGPMAVHIRL